MPHEKEELAVSHGGSFPSLCLDTFLRTHTERTTADGALGLDGSSPWCPTTWAVQSQIWLNYDNLRFCNKSLPAFISDLATLTAKGAPPAECRTPLLNERARARAEELFRLLQATPCLS